jgi:hypothetical protein
MLEKFERQLQVGGWVLVAVFVLLAVWLGQSISRTSEEGNVSDTFSVSGTGKVTVAPDIAVVDATISIERATAAAAQDEANIKSNSVVEYLKNAGIDSKDIKTSGYSLQPQYDWTDGRTRIRAYQVRQSITVKIRDMDKTNTVVDGIVDAGANEVGQIRFEIDEPEKLKAEAREKAIADAKAKADELADQLGIHFGKIVAFNESGDYPPIYYGRAEAMTLKADAAVAVPPALPAGENEISVSVTITYQIR